MRDVFENVFQKNLWGDPESASGPGSGVQRTAAFRDALAALLIERDVQTLLDAGCGDFNWIKEMELQCDYVGIDIVGDLIAHDRKYASNTRRFMIGDITRDPLPRVDLILCRDCLAHFSFAEIRAALRNFKASGSRYLLATTFVGRRGNIDIATGGWWPINLEAEPFDLPNPLTMIDEKCLHTGGIYADKRLALWQLDDVRA